MTPDDSQEVEFERLEVLQRLTTGQACWLMFSIARSAAWSAPDKRRADIQIGLLTQADKLDSLDARILLHPYGMMAKAFRQRFTICWLPFAGDQHLLDGYLRTCWLAYVEAETTHLCADSRAAKAILEAAIHGFAPTGSAAASALESILCVRYGGMKDS